MLFLAPLISTLLFVAFMALAIRKGVRSRPDLASKQGSLVELWRNRRARLFVLLGLYLCGLYGGGLAGAAVANKGVETGFMAFVFASLLGQVAILSIVSVSISMVRGVLSIRRMRHP